MDIILYLKNYRFMKTILIILAFAFSEILPQWKKVESIPDVDIYSLYKSGSKIYAGAEGYIYISSDGGNNWQQSAKVHPDADVVSALIKYNDILFAGTYGFGVFISENEGDSWTEYNSGLTGMGSETISDFEFGKGKIFVSTIGASVFSIDPANLIFWQPYSNGIPMAYAGNTYDLFISDDILIAGAGGNAAVYLNPAGTDLWSEVFFSSFNGEPVTMLSIGKTGNIIAGAATNGIFISTNSGYDWQLINDEHGFISDADISVFNEELIISLTKLGRGTYYYRLFNTGNLEFLEYQQGVQVIPIIISGSRLFTGRLYDGVWYKDLSTTDINDPEDDVITGFKLYNNYPNPFNPTTKIKYSIPSVIASETKQSPYVNLKIFDVLGSEIATLVNEEKQPGVYEINFNASGLTSGTYFYRLQAGSYVETKKMILLK